MIYLWNKSEIEDAAGIRAMPDRLWIAKAIDIDTGENVRQVLWYDDELHELERMQLDANGNAMLAQNRDELLIVREHRRLTIVPLGDQCPSFPTVT